jgi:hypothetical protein
MSNHNKALIPLESWSYQSPEIRYSGKTLDLGLFAEGLIYYDIIMLHITNQPQLAEFINWFQRQNKFSELISLFDDKTIQLYDYSFSSAAILHDGKYTIFNIHDERQNRKNSFEERFLYHKSIDDCIQNPRDRKRLYKALRGKVIEAKASEFDEAIENARVDYHDPSRARIMLQLLVDEIAPILGWAISPDIEVTMTRDGDDTIFNYNINFKEIAKKLGPDLNFHLGAPLTGIAHCNRLIQTGLNEHCDLFLGSPMSSLVGDKLFEAQSKGVKISNIIESLNREVEFPDIRNLVNNGKMTFSEVMEVRKKARKFRNWLQDESERDRNAIIAYHSEVAREAGLIVASRRALNLFGYIGGITTKAVISSMIDGIPGQTIGTLAGDGVKYLVNLTSKIGSDWKPVVFGKWLEAKTKTFSLRD